MEVKVIASASPDLLEVISVILLTAMLPFAVRNMIRDWRSGTALVEPPRSWPWSRASWIYLRRGAEINVVALVIVMPFVDLSLLGVNGRVFDPLFGMAIFIFIVFTLVGFWCGVVGSPRFLIHPKMRDISLSDEPPRRAPQPGWYPNPEDPRYEWYWDGARWADNRPVASRLSRGVNL